MKILWIVLAAIAGLILLVLLLLFFGKAKIRIVFRKKLKVVAYLFGVPITLVSDKEKEDRKKDLSNCRNPEKVLKREQRKRRRRLEKALKKKRKAEQKAAKKAKKKHDKKVAAYFAPTPNLKENIEMITALLKKLHKETKGRISIRVKRFHLYVGAEDAAKTAVLYGVILQSVAYLLQVIETHFTHIRRKDGAMEVRPDYLSGQTHADIDLFCSLRLITGVRIGLNMLVAYRSEKKKATKKAKKRLESKPAA